MTEPVEAPSARDLKGERLLGRWTCVRTVRDEYRGITIIRLVTGVFALALVGAAAYGDSSPRSLVWPLVVGVTAATIALMGGLSLLALVRRKGNASSVALTDGSVLLDSAGSGRWKHVCDLRRLVGVQLVGDRPTGGVSIQFTMDSGHARFGPLSRRDADGLMLLLSQESLAPDSVTVFDDRLVNGQGRAVG